MGDCAISFVGDIALNGKYVDMFKRERRPFDHLVPKIPPSDEIVGNLECLAEGEQGINSQKNPRLTTTLETLGYLEQIGISVACFANNHAYDHLEDGFRKTKRKLSNMNILCMGAGTCASVCRAPLIVKKPSVSVAMLNYVTNDTNPRVPEDAGVYLNLFHEPTAVSDIESLRHQVEHLVIILHWGGDMENAYYPDWQQTEVAHRLIDCGADLIVGHHSHTLQPYEIYKGKYIFYSLGNFCFSEIKANGIRVGLQGTRHTESVVLTARFRKDDYTVHLLPFENVEGTLVPKLSVKKKLEMRSRVFRVLFQSRYLWVIYRFGFRYIRPVVYYTSRRDRSLGEKLRGVTLGKLMRLLRS